MQAKAVLPLSRAGRSSQGAEIETQLTWRSSWHLAPSENLRFDFLKLKGSMKDSEDEPRGLEFKPSHRYSLEQL